jgi:peptidoglycan L-alanyl-D-glutamate endopeptidase CwlK
MGVNRNIDALKPPMPEMVRRTIARVKEEIGINLLVIETDRIQAMQDALYAQGRESLEEVNRLRAIVGLAPITAEENKRTVTNARVSNHTGGNAVDLCPENPDKPGWAWWNAPREIWEAIGRIAEECGLDWCAGGYGQTWGKGWDNPHFELMK